MSIVTKTVLKGYFESGDTPTAAQFIDLIDTLLAIQSDGSIDIPNILGNKLTFKFSSVATLPSFVTYKGMFAYTESENKVYYANGSTWLEILDVNSAASPHAHTNKSVLDLITAAFTSAQSSKLTGIETSATADQTGAEIKSLYELESNTNAFTDTEKTKLSGIEASATADQTGPEIKIAYEGEANTNAYTDTEKSKLSGIDANAKDDQTGSEIKTAYENEANTNAYTDTEKSKLSGIDAGAKDDQTGSEIKIAYEGESDTNAYTDTEKSKLSGISAGAEVNPEVVSQAEAEAGTATTEKTWTAQRVAQAIAALGGGGGGGGSDGIAVYIPGNAYVANGIVRVTIPKAATLTKILARVTTAPTGTALTLNVRKNSDSTNDISTSDLSISATTFTANSTVLDATHKVLAENDYISFCITAVGGTIAGADLMITLIY